MPQAHLTVFTFKPAIHSASRELVLAQFQKLGRDTGGVEAGILFFSVTKNMDPMETFDLLQNTVFIDDEAKKRYQEHPAHVNMVEDLKKTMDWKHLYRGVQY